MTEYTWLVLDHLSAMVGRKGKEAGLRYRHAIARGYRTGDSAQAVAEAIAARAVG